MPDSSTELPPPVKGVLLDSSTLIELLRSNPTVQLTIDQLLDSGYDIATSVACVSELYGGLRVGEEAITDQLFSTLNCLPLTFSIAKRAGAIKASRSRIGHTHGIVDMMIAATALEHGYLLATENRRDFAIPGLTLI
jgi:predicted nucleic acid-binding protein